MNYLVGDIGNTLTKICLVNKKSKIVKEYSIETKKLLNNNNFNNLFFFILKKKTKKKKKKKYYFLALFQKFIIKLINFLLKITFFVLKLKSYL